MISSTDDNYFEGGSLFDTAEVASAAPPEVVRISVTSFCEQFVRENDKILFNTNNHQEYEVDPSNPLQLRVRSDGKRRIELQDYAAKLAQCRTEHWVDEFHTHYRVINIPKHHLLWMKTASVVACQKAGMSPAFEDDVEDAVRTIATGNTFHLCDRSDPSTGYFVRTDTVSLKDGLHGAGPYFALKEMIESTITARMGHQGVDGATASLKYYLFPWKSNLHRHREFRVFVCNRRVTAISQQSLYDANEILASVGDSREDVATIIRNWCGRLLPFIRNTVLPKLTTLSEFVMDIVLLGPPPCDGSSGLVDLVTPEALTPYFIEINPFGFAYSSGSSLFHWVNDFATLHGLSNSEQHSESSNIAFRYTATSASVLRGVEIIL